MSCEQASLEPYFRGSRLYGDDFSLPEIEKWFTEEKEGYYQLEDRTNYHYGYHALNWHHGFSRLPDQKFENVLGFGSARGDELAPILDRVSLVNIVEPSDGFRVSGVQGVPVTYSAPKPSGLLEFPDKSFDLIVCLGVLHHIPNVSSVLRELYRVQRPSGYMLLREPVVSLGDWRQPRKGLTKNERGIPLQLLRDILCTVGFELVREAKCAHSLTSRLNYILKNGPYNSGLVVALDALLCKLPWRNNYHPKNMIERLRVWSAFYVLRKPS
jgi:SAM-dependent methyltransferase